MKITVFWPMSSFNRTHWCFLSVIYYVCIFLLTLRFSFTCFICCLYLCFCEMLLPIFFFLAIKLCSDITGKICMWTTSSYLLAQHIAAGGYFLYFLLDDGLSRDTALSSRKSVKKKFSFFVFFCDLEVFLQLSTSLGWKTLPHSCMLVF